MFKFIQRQIDVNLIKVSLVFALIYCVLFNSSVFLYKFEYYQADVLTATLEIAKDFVYVVITLFVFFFGLSIHRIIFIFGSLALFITGAFASYYLFFFSIAPTQGIMPSIFGTNTTEIYELMGLKIIIWVVFSILTCLYLIKRFNVQNTKLCLTWILSASCFVIMVINVMVPKYSYMKSYFPTQYLHNSYIFFFGHSDGYAKKDISTEFEFYDSFDKDIIGVLVIGEAARYGNFGINGYKRDTTPNLSRVEDLVSYKARSCANTTYLSVPCMLSRYGEKDINLVDSETSILSVLTRLGFNTVWMGTQSITKYYRNKKGGSFYDEVDFHMIPGGSLVFLPNDLDEKMFPYIEQNIKSKGKTFLVLHTTGSHWNYSARYTEKFAKFKPDLDASIKHDASSCSNEELVNSYDNSILYTDFFLSHVIEVLKDKKAFLIYASDHGESLGECGRLTHGSDGFIKEQREVPFMVWVSNSYKAEQPKKWLAIEASKENNNISHDYIFHSILDCLGIQSKAIDNSLSLCSSKSINQ